MILTLPQVRAAEPMLPMDAVWHWLATKFATDQFLVYAFAGEPRSVDQAVEEVLDRARRCDEFALRIRRRSLNLRFPEWVPGTPVDARNVVRRSPGLTWQAFLDEVALTMDEQLDPSLSTWRMHVFPGVGGVPHSDGAATVVVLQVAHALGDGTRTAALAGMLFGRADGPPPISPHPGGQRLRRITAARRARDELARDTAAGVVAAKPPPVPALRTNRTPRGRTVLRTIARRPDEFPGPTVLVGALVAVSEALGGHLAERGEDVSALSAAVAIADPGKPSARNHFHTHSVRLHPESTTRAERCRRIAGELMDIRRRAAHPAVAAQSAAFDAIPAAIRRLRIWRLSADAEAAVVPANTVVSSVDRGAADLAFGGCRVLLTASYPSLMPTMGLTHGVHRIGDTVAISVHTTEAVMPDIDDYLARLHRALDG